MIPELVSYLQGMFIWGHPRSQINVVPNPSIASIIGVLLPLIYNPNLCSDESGRRFSEAEVRASRDGGRTGGLRSAAGRRRVHLRRHRRTAVRRQSGPGKSRAGVEPDAASSNQAVILASEQSHYSCLNVASWLGIGQDNVRPACRRTWTTRFSSPAWNTRPARRCPAGKKIAAIVATMGSTDAFGIDDLRAIDAMRRRLVDEFSLDYVPHLHADAVIGWAWSVFNDYDFLANPLGFRGRTVRALAAAQHDIQHLPLADSIGIDFHKTGYTPYMSSLVLFRDGARFRLHRPRPRDDALFVPVGRAPSRHVHAGNDAQRDRADGGAGQSAVFGKEGYRALLGHAVEMAEVLREMIESHPNLSVLNGENVGPVTLFRAYPDGVDTFSVKALERSDAGSSPAAAGAQRVQPPDLRARARRGPGGPGVADLADRLLSPDRLRRADRGAQVVRALAVFRREPHAVDRRRTSWPPGKD